MLWCHDQINQFQRSNTFKFCGNVEVKNKIQHLLGTWHLQTKKKKLKRSCERNMTSLGSCVPSIAWVQLRAPSEKPLIYVNHGGTLFINVQIICGTMWKITHVFQMILYWAMTAFLANTAGPNSSIPQGQSTALKAWMITPFIIPAPLAFNGKPTKTNRNSIGMFEVL